MYKVFTYKENRFTPALNNQEFKSLSDVQRALGFWYDVRRNDISTVFYIVDKHNLVNIIKYQDGKVTTVYVYSSYPYEKLEKAN